MILRLDARAKLHNMLQVVAFCVVVAVLLYVFSPERRMAPALVYSLAIGLVTWCVVDLGRHVFPSAGETGWPRGPAGMLLVPAGIAAGYFLGTGIADAICTAFGLYGTQRRASDLRTAVLVSALAGIAGSYYFYSASRSSYLQRKMAEARRQADDARLKLLETQLEPHMLFNTLANLRALMAVDPPRAQHMLDHMIAYLRSTLDASRAATHPLQAEFDRLRDYLELMAIRMGPRLAYRLDLPPELAGLPVPALLLQPLVENAIQHGLEPKVGGGRIDVRVAREGAQLAIEVDDTGMGDQQGDSGGKGFGLAQVRERLATLYGARAGLAFHATADGAQVRITLPIA